jgi:PAS domain S-box-containing protein
VFGPLLTLALILALEVIGRSWPFVPGPLLLVGIAVSALVGGLASGLVSAALSAVYLGHVFSTPGALLRFSPEDLGHFFFLLVLAPLMALLVSLLKRRSDRPAREAAWGAGEQADALHASDERYRALFERSPAGVFLVGRDDGLLDVNDATVRMLGYASREAARGDPIQSLFVEPSQRREVLERLERGEVVANEEVRFRCKDGRLIWVLMSARRVGEGPAARFEGQLLDVTERRLAVEALAESERRSSELIEHASDGIVSVDPEGRLLSANPAVTRISGWAADELLGRDFRQLGIIAEDSLPVAAARFPQTLSGQTGRPYELEIVRRDGARAVVEVSSSPIWREGRVAGVQVILRDITERKRAEQAQRRTEALRSATLLAGAAAHEINNPLSVIIGRTQMLMEAVEAASPLRRHLQAVLWAAEKIQDIVVRMAQITRIEVAPEREGLPAILDIRRSVGEPADLPPGDVQRTSGGGGRA